LPGEKPRVRVGDDLNKPNGLIPVLTCDMAKLSPQQTRKYNSYSYRLKLQANYPNRKRIDN